ncbi:mCG1037553, partial [Mus musculus]
DLVDDKEIFIYLNGNSPIHKDFPETSYREGRSLKSKHQEDQAPFQKENISYLFQTLVAPSTSWPKATWIQYLPPSSQGRLPGVFYKDIHQ